MTEDVICERNYQTAIDGEIRPVPVQWMKPALEPTGDWSCTFRIEWPHRPERVRKCFGIDSVQALQLALDAVAVELYTAEPPVYWWSPNDILGLSVPEDSAHLEAARSEGRP